MSPSETIRLQALKLKATIDGSHPSLFDAIINDPSNKEELKKQFRNVCALIPIVQFDELERICSTLDLSKRQIITMALSEFVLKADAIIAEVDPYENLEDSQKAEDDVQIQLASDEESK